jgi:predicted HicB family RNase H-like nuclease
MKKPQETFTKKISVRLTDKQYKMVVKNAKASKMSMAEYSRACML